MKIKQTITDRDLDQIYDLIIFTTFAMFALIAIAKIAEAL